MTGPQRGSSHPFSGKMIRSFAIDLTSPCTTLLDSDFDGNRLIPISRVWLTCMCFVFVDKDLRMISVRIEHDYEVVIPFCVFFRRT